jgi:hypothetical protein
MEKGNNSETKSEKKSLISFAFSGTPTITSHKLNGKNYLDWRNAVEIWFLGQALFDHLEKKADDIVDAKREEWKQADFQLLALLFQSIESNLMVHFRPYRTCHEVWKKAQTVYANDIQRLYETIHNLTTLQMSDLNLSGYLNKAQSVCEEAKLMLLNQDAKKMAEKLDNMIMVFVLHGLHKKFEYVRNQTLTNSEVPMLEVLFDRLLRVPSPNESINTDVAAPIESSMLMSNSANRGGRGRGRRGGGRGRGGKENMSCTYCKLDGHTRDWCYSLHGFPVKTANVAQSPGRLSSRSSNLKLIVNIKSTFGLRQLKRHRHHQLLLL